MITRENWTHCIYTHPNADLTAQMSYGADYSEGQLQDLYFVTVRDEESEHRQWSFDTFGAAEIFMNNSYSDWIFVDLLTVRQASSGTGCDSCQAH